MLSKKRIEHALKKVLKYEYADGDKMYCYINSMTIDYDETEYITYCINFGNADRDYYRTVKINVDGRFLKVGILQGIFLELLGSDGE